jgi:hypothetical protein
MTTVDSMTPRPREDLDFVGQDSPISVFFSSAAFTKTPSKTPKKKATGCTSSFGGFGGEPNCNMGGIGDAGNDLADVGPPLTSPVGFQEPLPVPEMQEDDKSRSRRSSMFRLMGKGSKRFISKFKLPAKRNAGGDHGGGFMMDDDDDQFEGGMGLLG